MTDEQLRKLTKALVDYKNEYASANNEVNYKDETYDELMQMLHVGIDACPEMWQYVREFEESPEEQAKVENDVKSTLDLRVDSLRLAIESGNLIEILNESKLLVGYMVDDLPEFFSDEPLVEVLNKGVLHEIALRDKDFEQDLRRYLITWDNYTYNNEPEIWVMDKFRDNEGFSEEDLNQIVMLSINEEYETGNITIRRIK